jgi:hypothetical protein
MVYVIGPRGGWQVAPITIHPAHEKAAHYFDITIVHIPVGNDGLPNVDDYEKVFNILLQIYYCILYSVFLFYIMFFDYLLSGTCFFTCFLFMMSQVEYSGAPAGRC